MAEPSSDSLPSCSDVTLNFAIVGAPKCGTTSLQEYLGEHPGVYMPQGANKEPHYFMPDYGASWHVKTAEAYASLFAGAAPGQQLGEASTWYLYSPQAAKALHRHNPRARIIICVREPVAMVLSLYKHNINGGQEDVLAFAEAVNLEPQRTSKAAAPLAADWRQLQYTKAGLFAEHIERYQQLFGTDQVKVIALDDLIADAGRVMADTCAFLGIDASFEPTPGVHNAAKPVRNLAIRRLKQRMPIARRLDQALPRSLHRLLRDAAAVVTRDGSRIVVTDSDKKQLAEHFRPSVQRLSELTGRDFVSLWSGD